MAKVEQEETWTIRAKTRDISIKIAVMWNYNFIPNLIPREN